MSKIDKSFIERRFKHAESRAEEIKIDHGENPADRINYYGGKDLGWWEGMAYAYDFIVGMMEELDPNKEENHIYIISFYNKIKSRRDVVEIEFDTEEGAIYEFFKAYDKELYQIDGWDLVIRKDKL